MNLTEYYSLQKPISEEKYSVNVTNMNMDLIDSALNRIEQQNKTQDELLASKEALNEHTSAKTNPHKVTKSQIGLGNADNTSDMDKPVSIPQQDAINDMISVHNTSDLSHDDIRLLISKLTTNKVNISDIIEDLTSMQENIESGKLVDALVIKEVFQSVSKGKKMIASAITDKGVNTDATATFEVMADNISDIVTNDGSTENDPISSPYTFSINWYQFSICSSGTINNFIPFAITKLKRFIIKKLYFVGKKTSTSNSIAAAFRIYGTKKGDTSQTIIKDYTLRLTGSSTNFTTVANIADEEIDLSEWEEVNGISFYKWSYSGTVTEGIVTIQFDAELYF